MSLESYIVFSHLYCSSTLQQTKLDAAYCSDSYLVKQWKAQQFWSQMFDDAAVCQSDLFCSRTAYLSVLERNNFTWINK